MMTEAVQVGGSTLACKREKVKINGSREAKNLANSVGTKLQKVKNSVSRGSKKQANPIQRELTVTSRELDYFSEKELVNQTGHPQKEWHLAIVKELLDNALDACDDRDIPPQITVVIAADGITVSDNGPGIPQATIDKALDFRVRASSREAYVSPDRGAQGNALKTLISMPYVLDPAEGRLIITSNGIRRSIKVYDDPISQQPIVTEDTDEVEGHSGTTVSVKWSPVCEDAGRIPACGWPMFKGDGYEAWQIKASIRKLIAEFRLFNPHASIHLDEFGELDVWEASDSGWKKWKPTNPSSSHWYDNASLNRLIRALLIIDRDRGEIRTVGKLLEQFDGLAGSKKRAQVLDACNLQRVQLSALIGSDGQLDDNKIQQLLSAMQEATKPVKPHRLGVIGEAHFRRCFVSIGVAENSICYCKKQNFDEPTGLPYVLETCFGYRGTGERVILPGVNWSGAIHQPFRTFGQSGQGLEGFLSERYVGSEEPVAFAIHLTNPRVQYTDRGKSAIVLNGKGAHNG